MSLLDQALKIKRQRNKRKETFTKEMVEVFVAYVNGQITSTQAGRVLETKLEGFNRTSLNGYTTTAIRYGIQRGWIKLTMK